MLEFFSEYTIAAARKDHRCESCQTTILAGESYVYMAGKWDGDLFITKNHPECRKAECDYAHQNGLSGGDEWQWLYDMDSEDREWLKENHPAAAKRLSDR